MSTVDKAILFVGHTFSGHNHDYSMLKNEFPPEHARFDELAVWVELGNIGVPTDYRGGDILLLHKKPLRSKKNPDPCNLAMSNRWPTDPSVRCASLLKMRLVV